VSTIRAKTSPRKKEIDAGPVGSQSILGVPVVDVAIALGLMLAVFAIYAQTGSFDFINWDDPQYVTANPQVQAGLTWDSIKWAITAIVSTNWMPVTLFSHMLDCELFHTRAGMHHLHNMLLHLIATLLLFASLKRATGTRWPSAFAALLFAVHPLHVESVAWIAERKDVLSASFWFLALYLYIRYSERPSAGRYSLVLIAFALGLMAKPMLVTFPCTLILLDVWPLRRISAASWGRLIAEKIPMFLMSLGASSVTYHVQNTVPYPLPMRLANAVVAYAVYIGQFMLPVRLGVLYIYREAPTLWQTVGAAVLLLAITAGVIWQRKARPYLAVGWFWYLGTLVPVIGLVQVGVQSHADRYMYVPMVGLLVMIAWGGADLIANRPAFKTGIATAAALAGIAYTAMAYVQTEYWQNAGLLFAHDLEFTEGNFIAELQLGNYLMDSHRGLEAIPHFEAAVRYDPQYGEAENNIGMILAAIPGRIQEGILHFEAALRARPNLPEAHYNLALALLQLPGREDEAIAHLETVQRVAPRPDIPALIQEIRTRRK
jgi:tetratricopeptide (TPR) repeat protein